MKNGKLHFREAHILVESMKGAANKFIQWLKERAPCVLVAHNSQFDVRILKHMLDKIKEQLDYSIVLGFCNSYSIFKRKCPALNSYKQESLSRKFLQESYDAHTAATDVDILRKLVSCKLSDCDLLESTESLESTFYRVDYSDSKALNIESYPVSAMIASGISFGMIEKMAGSRLEWKHVPLYHLSKRWKG